MTNNIGKLYRWFINNYPYWVIWVGPLILFGPLLLSGKVVFWGTAYLQFLPWRVAGWEQMSRGLFPLWNSYNGYGAPLLANYQSAFFYPPNILVWIFADLKGIQGIAIAQTLLILLHLAMAGYGMVYLTKELGFTKLGQAVAAVAFSLSGYLVSRASFISVNSVLTWIPWILFTALHIAKLSSIKSALTNKYLILSIIFHTLLLLAGHAQIAWYTLILSFFWTLTWSWFNHKWSKIGVTIGILAITVGFSVGLSAIQLIPTAEFLIQSQRSSNVDYAYALNYSFWPWRFLTLISANLFGNPAHGNYWVTADNYWEDNIYTGVLSIVFALTAIVRLILRHYEKSSGPKTIVIFSILALGFSVILTLGKYTPVYPFLYRFIPTFDMFQAPTRFSIWLVLAVSMLAGMGIDRWKKPDGKWLYWSRLLAAGAIGIAITSIAARFVLKINVQETFIIGVAETGVLLSILLLINLFAPREGQDQKASSPIMTFIILIFLIGDLVYANWGINPGLNIKAINSGEASKQASIQPESQSMMYITDSIEQEIKFGKFFHFNSFSYKSGWEELTKYIIPNSNILKGLAAFNNFDPFVTERYDQLSQRIIPQISEEDSEFNRFWAIGDVIHDILPPNLDANNNQDDTYRIRWFNCEIPSQGLAQSVELFDKIIDDGSYTNYAVIEGLDSDNILCSENKEELKIVDYWSNPLSIQMNVVAPSDGWLLQLSTNYPGWKARVDGREVKVHYGDILFRAIKLSKGSHSIEFYFLPLSFSIGISISSCFLCLIFVFIILQRKKFSNDNEYTLQNDKINYLDRVEKIENHVIVQLDNSHRKSIF